MRGDYNVSYALIRSSRVPWAIVCILIAAAPAQAAARTAVELDALATLGYKSAQTDLVSARLADAQLLSLRAQVDASGGALSRARSQLTALQAGVRRDRLAIGRLEAQVEALIGDLARSKTAFTDELARRDADYARNIAILRTAGEQLLATPDGVRALELYNAGGPGAFEAADTVLGKVEEARAKAREDVARKQQADDRRARARLALDARDKGLTQTAVAIQRWEAVVAVDASTVRDWATLCDLYLDAGRANKAIAAAEKARAAASDAEGLTVATERRGLALAAIGDLRGALDAFEKTLALDRAAAKAGPGVAKLNQNLSASLRDVASAMRELGDLPGALAALEEALAIDKSLLLADSGIEFRRTVSVDISLIARIAFDQGDLAKAEAGYADSLARDRAILAADPQSQLSRRNVAVGVSQLGNVAAARGETAKAVTLFTDAKAIDDAIALTDPSARALLFQTDDLDSVAWALREQGRPLDAMAPLDARILIGRRIVAIDPSSFVAQQALAASLQARARFDVLRGFYDQAIDPLKEALEIQRRFLGMSPTPRQQQRTAEALFLLAEPEELRGELQSPRSAYEEAATLLRAVLKIDRSQGVQSDFARVLDDLADIEFRQKDYSASLAQAKEAERVRRALLAIDPSSADARSALSRTLYALARSQRQAGDLAGAVITTKERVDLSRGVALLDPTSVAAKQAWNDALEDLARLYGLMGDGAAQNATLRANLSFARETVKSNPASDAARNILSTAMKKLAALSSTSSTEALSLYEEMLDQKRKNVDAYPTLTPQKVYFGMTAIDVARRRRDAGNRAGAISLYEEGIAALRLVKSDYPLDSGLDAQLTFGTVELAELRGTRESWQDALAALQDLQAAGRLSADDAIKFLPKAQALATGQPWPARPSNAESSTK